VKSVRSARLPSIFPVTVTIHTRSAEPRSQSGRRLAVDPIVRGLIGACNMLTNTQHFWTNAWSRHYENYAGTVSRQAYYLDFILRPADRTLLEIGAGSFRDTVQLNEWGYTCTGTDFSTEAVQLAKEKYSAWADQIHAMDASALDFPDKSFDVSFHNGFFVLFADNEVIDGFVREQVRVTKKRVICTVHNALNARLAQTFSHKSNSDSLYDIRFFRPDELHEILQPHCKKVEVLPFGQRTMDRCIRHLGWRGPLKHAYRATCRFGFRQAERLMAIGDLE
jgi:hypothetical protein